MIDYSVDKRRKGCSWLSLFIPALCTTVLHGTRNSLFSKRSRFSGTNEKLPTIPFLGTWATRQQCITPFHAWRV